MSEFNDPFREKYGETVIFRPSMTTILELRRKTGQWLRARYPPGEYSSKDDINNILNDYVQHHFKNILSIIDNCSSYETLIFFLEQYEKTANISSNQRDDRLTTEESLLWSKHGPIIRKSLRFLCDTIVIRNQPNRSTQISVSELQLEELIIHSEEAIRLSVGSDATYHNEEGDIQIKILHPERDAIYSIRFEQSTNVSEYENRIHAAVNEFQKHPDIHKIFRSAKNVEVYLDDKFKQVRGFTLSDVFKLFELLILKSQRTGETIQSFERDRLVEVIGELLSLSSNQVNILLRGLTISECTLGDAPNYPWDHRRHNKLHGKPFYEINQANSNRIVTFSTERLKECHFELFSMLRESKLPAEWFTRELNNSVQKYSQAISKDFENYIVEELRNLHAPKIFCSRFSKKIGSQNRYFRIPNQIGDLDILAYLPHEELLVIGECKVSKVPNDPRTFDSELRKFHDYQHQLNRKLEWCKQNISNIEQYLWLNEHFPNDIRIKFVSPILITYYPSFATAHVNGFQCVSITELLSGLVAKQGWAFPPILPIIE
ncbi:hypothetical protein Pla110_11630 [Polystyrenella longa]|uniref:Uncharacterized protein n=1 Tax=Polystyrenella longa TaxID=2528007 RepID=A0A518CJP7_9PLAN|nr:hypothetical protein [Polystyrenella longa]QDU79453.1 hypothetical protein Pla110_11630 [Polystyrenella longa]